MGKYMLQSNDYSNSLDGVMENISECISTLQEAVGKLDLTAVDGDVLVKNIVEAINNILDGIDNVSDIIISSKKNVKSKAKEIDVRLERLAQKKSDEKTFTAVEEKF